MSTPYLILTQAQEVQTWPFYGQAVKHLKEGVLYAGDEEERIRKIKQDLALRERYLTQHEQAAAKLRQDIETLKGHLPPEE